MAEELQPAFTDGVWFCDLAPLFEPNLVADAVAQALGVMTPTGDRFQAVQEHLRDRSALLVLDNCEHVATSAAATIRDLLASSHGVRVLTTSRSPLGLIGEAIYRLDPMLEDDAMRLFEDRAETAVPDFQLGVANADVIAAICRRLNGLPLAIELVVPRLRVQSPAELAAALLEPAWQAASSHRHGSLYAVADWSYRLMTPSQQSVFRKVGIFPSWFEPDDALALAPETGTSMPLLLGSLVEQAMLVQEQSPSRSRYRLLDTLRAFALQRLEEAGELESVRLDHAEHVVWLVEHLWPATGAALQQTASMVDDVRAALNTLLREQPRRAAFLNASMMPIWRADGRAEEGLAWSERTLAANPDPSPERCQSLFQHAHLAAKIGHLKETADYLRQAEAIADSPGNEELRSQTLTVRGACRALTGDLESALRLSQAAIEDAELRGNDYLLAYALNGHAMSLLWLGRFREAADHAARAVRLHRAVNPRRLDFLDTMAQAHVLLGELGQARRSWLEAAEGGIEIGWRDGLPYCLWGLAMVAALEGQEESALRFHLAAEQLNADVNISFAEPISTREAELITRVTDELGPEIVERIRSESRVFDPTQLLRFVQANA